MITDVGVMGCTLLSSMSSNCGSDSPSENSTLFFQTSFVSFIYAPSRCLEMYLRPSQPPNLYIRNKLRIYFSYNTSFLFPNHQSSSTLVHVTPSFYYKYLISDY